MCLPLQMPETSSMGSMLCLRRRGVGNCQGVVPGLCVLDLPVTQAAQPHARALRTCNATLSADCSSCSSCRPAGVCGCWCR